jgi:hypothetical protein
MAVQLGVRGKSQKSCISDRDNIDNVCRFSVLVKDHNVNIVVLLLVAGS